MAKLSPRFVTYFIFASLALAFIFPITHSAYEGLANKGKDEENSDEEEEIEEGLENSMRPKNKNKNSIIDKVVSKAKAAVGARQ